MQKENELIKIDGSYLEGGGQTIRISLCLSAVLRKNVEIMKIRSGRSNPGLQKQHLNSALSIIEIFSQIGEDIKLNSQKIIIRNKEDYSNFQIKKLEKIDVDGAGSIGLVIQELLPALILCKSEELYCTNIRGGTIVNFSPSTYYLNDVFFHLLKMKYDSILCSLNVNRHGFFPIGQGNVDLTIKTNKKLDFFPSLNLLSRGNLKKILIRSIYTSSININDITKVHKSVIKEVKTLVRSKEIEKAKKIEEKMKNLNLKSENKKEISNSNEEKNNSDEEEIDNVDEELDKIYNKNKTIIEDDSVSDSLFEDCIFVFNDKKSFTHVLEIISYYENSVVYHELKYSEKKNYSEETINKLKRELITEFEETLNREDKIVDEYTLDHLIIFMALSSKNETSTIISNMLSKHTLTALYVIRLISNMKYKVEIRQYDDDNYNFESESKNDNLDLNLNVNKEGNDKFKYVDITEKLLNLSGEEISKYIEDLNKNNTTFRLIINGIL